jgi:hypothetical protein
MNPRCKDASLASFASYVIWAESRVMRHWMLSVYAQSFLETLAETPVLYNEDHGYRVTQGRMPHSQAMNEVT